MSASDHSFESPPLCPDPPPLRIHHLMACTAVASVQLMLLRNAIPADMLEQLPALAKVTSAIGLSFSAVGLTFAVFSVYWQLKGYAALAQPGQWLLARHLVYLAQLLFGRLVVSHFRVTGSWGKSFALWNDQDYYYAVASVLHTILIIVNHAMPVLFYAWCAWRVADTRPWRIFFSICAIVSVLEATRLYLIPYTTWGWSLSQAVGANVICSSILTLSLLAWIIATDNRRRLRRFWTHWLGVGLYIASEVLGLASGLIVLFGGY